MFMNGEQNEMKGEMTDHYLCEVQNLTFAYERYTDTQEKTLAEPILQGLSFSVTEGEYVLVCGETGCGKSTLLKLLKKELQPAGKLDGQIFFKDKPLEEWKDRDYAGTVGYVMQDPNDQCVTDKVWHELAFGLENLGVKPEVIRRKVAEISAYFGIDDWYDKRVDELSGGQKQILNLASVMVMEPELLLLDEPTAQLDPIAAGNFLTMLKKLNKEFGITIILAEHRLEETFAAADKVLLLKKDGAVYQTPGAMMQELSEDLGIYRAMPESVKQLRALTVTEARAKLRHLLQAASGEYANRSGHTEEDRNCAAKDGNCSAEDGNCAEENGNGVAQGGENDRSAAAYETHRQEAALTVRDLWFRYEKNEPDILQDVSFELYAGELLCLLGNNGSGKTTLLKLISGMEPVQEGKIRLPGSKKEADRVGQIGYLPQDVETLFVTESVQQELALVGEDAGTELCPDTHPYDLSGGEKQLLGMKKVLAGEKKILLLDEPTKGLDASAKERLCNRILEEKKKGTAILMITHDPEFAVSCADRCGLLFRGKLVCVEKTRDFFRENNFYTTAAARIARGFSGDVVTGADLHKMIDNLQRGEACGL